MTIATAEAARTAAVAATEMRREADPAVLSAVAEPGVAAADRRCRQDAELAAGPAGAPAPGPTSPRPG